MSARAQLDRDEKPVALLRNAVQVAPDGAGWVRDRRQGKAARAG